MAYNLLIILYMSFNFNCETTFNRKPIQFHNMQKISLSEVRGCIQLKTYKFVLTNLKYAFGLCSKPTKPRTTGVKNTTGKNQGVGHDLLELKIKAVVFPYIYLNPLCVFFVINS